MEELMNDTNKKLLEITNRIFIIRDQKVMLDRDLAEIYGIEVKALNQAVKRNTNRFTVDFCFQLTTNEIEERWSQLVTIFDKKTAGYILRTPPYVFTEAGSFALSFTIRSAKAIEMGQFIIQAFTHLRRFILKNENLMMELKNNDHLSKTFSNFEKRIEQDLIVLYKKHIEI
ncbi:MAG: hypothetical protein ACI9QD_000337 [Thermoproteota archaeon]|jgi:hypothetical protein